MVNFLPLRGMKKEWGKIIIQIQSAKLKSAIQKSKLNFSNSAF